MNREHRDSNMERVIELLRNEPTSCGCSICELWKGITHKALALLEQAELASKGPPAGEFTKEVRRLLEDFWKSSNKIGRLQTKALEACDRLDA